MDDNFHVSPERAIAHWRKVLATPGLPGWTYDDARRCLRTLTGEEPLPAPPQGSTR